MCENAFVAIGIGSIHDFNERTANRLSTWLRESVKSGHRSAQTAEFYLSAIRRFVYWLGQQWVSVPADLLDDIPGFESSSNRTLTRGALSVDEFRRLLDAAKASKKSYRYLNGVDRRMLYLVAAYTGFRAKELSRLTPK